MAADREEITSHRIADESELDAVKSIYKAFKSTLGLMPDGAFSERYDKGTIYIAKSGETVVGYVLFAVTSNDDVRIDHLATAREWQGKGVARELVNALIDNYSSCKRIRLKVREDFAAARIYQRLGFESCGTLPGRRSEGSTLIGYQIRLNDMPLFKQEPSPGELPLVICDANVCFDIEEQSRPRHLASLGLLADWIAGEIRLAATGEVFNDIVRQAEPFRSEMDRAVRSNWDIRAADPVIVDSFLRKIQSLFGVAENDGDASDHKHLAIAGAEAASAFLTTDNALLSAAPDILSAIGVRVLEPSTLITELDSVAGASRVNYSELRNSGIERYSVSGFSDEEIDSLLDQAAGEKRRVFRAILKAASSHPREWDLHGIRGRSGSLYAYFAIRSEGPTLRCVDKFRVVKSVRATRFGRTLVDFAAQNPLGRLNEKEPTVMRVDDNCLTNDQVDALCRRGFFWIGPKLWRISLPGIWSEVSLNNALAMLERRSELPGEGVAHVAKLMKRALDSPLPECVQALEHAIYPGKVSFGDLPSYIIPIQHQWAQELFDFRLWQYPLLVPNTELVINPDSVYYKSARGGPATNAGRILWYVSGKKNDGGGMIRACSNMTECVTSDVKTLYHKFQQFGVYEWKDIMKGKNSASDPATAIHFTNTELFRKGLSFKEVNQLLVAGGMRNQQFMTCTRISQQAFGQIYEACLAAE